MANTTLMSSLTQPGVSGETTIVARVKSTSVHTGFRAAAVRVWSCGDGQVTRGEQHRAAHGQVFCFGGICPTRQFVHGSSLASGQDEFFTAAHRGEHLARRPPR